MIILALKTTEEYLADGQVVETNTCIPYKWVVRENWQGEDLDVFDTKSEAETFVKEYQQRQYQGMIKTAWGEIKELPKEKTAHLLAAYDEYVRQIVELGEGEPVTVAEFYENDYQDYFKNWKPDLL